MQPVPYQIVDQNRNPAGSQRFIHKLNRLFERQMVRKKVTAHYVKRFVAEGKSQRIARHRPKAVRRPGVAAIVQMGPHPIQQADLQMNPPGQHAVLERLGHVARAGRNFQKRQRFASRGLRYLLDHGFGGGEAAKPAIDEAQSANVAAISEGVPESVSSSSSVGCRFMDAKCRIQKAKPASCQSVLTTRSSVVSTTGNRELRTDHCFSLQRHTSASSSSSNCLL